MVVVVMGVDLSAGVMVVVVVMVESASVVVVTGCMQEVGSGVICRRSDCTQEVGSGPGGRVRAGGRVKQPYLQGSFQGGGRV